MSTSSFSTFVLNHEAWNRNATLNLKVVGIQHITDHYIFLSIFLKLPAFSSNNISITLLLSNMPWDEFPHLVAKIMKIGQKRPTKLPLTIITLSLDPV